MIAQMMSTEGEGLTELKFYVPLDTK